jgi:hypothetical protein
MNKGKVDDVGETLLCVPLSIPFISGNKHATADERKKRMLDVVLRNVDVIKEIK